MDKCYLCDNPFNDQKHKKHGEHIIQNAIGGRLIVEDILCETCGNKLERQIDSAFIAQLTPISVLVKDLARHRKNKSDSIKTTIEANLKVQLNTSDVSFTLNDDFSITPSKPIYIINGLKKIVTVIGKSPKQAASYAKSNEVNHLKNKDYSIETAGNLAPYLSSAHLKLDIENTTFLQGLLKVALGFAFQHGIERNMLEHFFEKNDILGDYEITKNEQLLTSCIWQYYPTTNEEKLYEMNKPEHEDSYPNHQLYLFNQSTNLYCYIELFGVIQKYVLLSNNYKGQEIREKYIQKTSKWSFNENDWIANSPSDLQILANTFNVDLNQSWEEIQDQISYKAKTRDYIIEPESQIEKVEHLVHFYLQCSIIEKKAKHLPLVQDFLEKTSNAQEKLGLSPFNLIKNNLEYFMHLIHKNYDDFRIGNAQDSCPQNSKTVAKDKIQKYVDLKLLELLSFSENSIKLEFKVLAKE